MLGCFALVLIGTQRASCFPRSFVRTAVQSPKELKAISQTSCGVLQRMGPQIQWVQSYVTADKVYCVYVAPDEASVRKHAQEGGFPANVVARVHTMIDPTTAE